MGPRPFGPNMGPRPFGPNMGPRPFGPNTGPEYSGPNIEPGNSGSKIGFKENFESIPLIEVPSIPQPMAMPQLPPSQRM